MCVPTGGCTCPGGTCPGGVSAGGVPAQVLPVELLDMFRMKQTKMYICTLKEFILDDLHYLMYKLELRLN